MKYLKHLDPCPQCKIGTLETDLIYGGGSERFLCTVCKKGFASPAYGSVHKYRYGWHNEESPKITLVDRID